MGAFGFNSFYYNIKNVMTLLLLGSQFESLFNNRLKRYWEPMHAMALIPFYNNNKNEIPLLFVGSGFELDGLHIFGI